jgi:hypothetical protein
MVASLFSWLAEGVAYAADPPFVPCTPIMPGCGLGPANVIADSFIPQLALFLIRVAGAGSVIFMVWAGLQMLLSMGDSGKLTKARWAIVYSLLGLAMTLMAQMFVSLLLSEEIGQSMVGDVIVSGIIPSTVRIILTILNVLFACMIVVSGIRMVLSQGKMDEFTAARQAVLWCIIGAIIINISHALVQAVLSFFGV